MKTLLRNTLLILSTLLIFSCGEKAEDGAMSAVYVISGSLGDGLSPASPIGTLPAAVETAKANGISMILVSGDFALSQQSENSAGLTLTDADHLTIIGGYDTSFSNVIDLSILNGNNADHVLWLSGCNHLTLSNFSIKRGTADGSGDHSMGGGIFIDGGADISLYVTVANCNATTGAGIYAEQCSSLTINGTFNNNEAGGDGGGIYLKSCGGSNLYGTFKRNTAGGSGGGIYLDASADCTIGASVTFNTAETGKGAGIYSTLSAELTADAVTKPNYNNDGEVTGTDNVKI